MTAILLDTHVLVWALAELAIEVARRKVALPGGVGAFVGEGCRRTGVVLLGIDLAHAAEVERLPHNHRDPFDRMLVAQARVEKLALLSYDAALDAYDVPRAWTAS